MSEEPEKPTKSAQCEMLANALETERKRSEEYLTQLKYARADIENMKKRFDRQLEEAKKYANERIIIEFLDIVDELEMAVKSASSFGSAEAMLQGVEMTLKKIKKILEDEEVFPVRSVGEPFDPEKHNAIARIEEEGVKGITIKEEVRKGYMMRGKVIRPSTVKVVVPSQSHKVTEGDKLK